MGTPSSRRSSPTRSRLRRLRPLLPSTCQSSSRSSAISASEPKRLRLWSTLLLGPEQEALLLPLNSEKFPKNVISLQNFNLLHSFYNKPDKDFPQLCIQIKYQTDFFV